MKKWVSILVLVCTLACLFSGCGADKGVAQAVIDFEKSGKEEVRKLSEENPNYHYYANPVVEVFCAYPLVRGASASELIEKHNFKSFVGDAEILALNSVYMIGIVFQRDDFTEEIHQKLIKIKEKEPQIEDLNLVMERPYVKSYMPKIEAYTNSATKLAYESAGNFANKDGEPGFIIESKEEYDAYIDKYIETEDAAYKQRFKDKYEALFFEENALVITARITRSSGSHRLTIDGVYISNSKAYVVVRTDEAGMGTADMKYATFALQVKKGDVAGVTEVITLE